MHESLMLVDPDGNPGKPQRLQGGTLLRLLRALLVCSHPKLHTTFLRGHQPLSRPGIRQSIYRDIDIPLGLLIERHQTIERGIVGSIEHFDVGAEQPLRLHEKAQTERSDPDGYGAADVHRGSGSVHSISKSILKCSSVASRACGAARASHERR